MPLSRELPAAHMPAVLQNEVECCSVPSMLTPSAQHRLSRQRSTARSVRRGEARTFNASNNNPSFVETHCESHEQNIGAEAECREGPTCQQTPARRAEAQSIAYGVRNEAV